MWAKVRKSATELAPTFSRYWFHDGATAVACCDRFSGVINHSIGCRLQSTDAAQQTVDAQGDPNVVRLRALRRMDSGSRAATKLRATGRVPGSLFSFEGQGEREGRLLLSFDKREIMQLYRGLGMYGWACQVFDIDMEDIDGSLKTYRALGRQIHVTASSEEPENVTLISFYPGRKVKVNVPLKTFGSEVSPGIKSGGRVNWIRRTIPCVVSSGQVPTHFEVDISTLAVNDKFLWKELDIPSNVSVLLQDPRQPVLKIARR